MSVGPLIIAQWWLDDNWLISDAQQANLARKSTQKPHQPCAECTLTKGWARKGEQRWLRAHSWLKVCVRLGDSQKQFDGCNRDQKNKKRGRTRMEDKSKNTSQMWCYWKCCELLKNSLNATSTQHGCRGHSRGMQTQLGWLEQLIEQWALGREKGSKIWISSVYTRYLKGELYSMMKCT